MRLSKRVVQAAIFFVIFVISAAAQNSVILTIVDENNVAVPGAEVIVEEAGKPPVRLTTDYNGRVTFLPPGDAPYTVRVSKPGYYASTSNDNDPAQREVRVVLNHEQMVVQQVNVAASVPGIDPEQVSDRLTMSLPEIINIPYPTSRDIRNLLPFYPGVVQDTSGQIHVAGSETWGTLDMLDGFDIRSPVSGILGMRVSADAVRSIDQETTRYPVEFGRATLGRRRLLHRHGRQQVSLQRHRLHSFVAPGERPAFRQVRPPVHLHRSSAAQSRVVLRRPRARVRPHLHQGTPEERRYEQPDPREQPVSRAGECCAAEYHYGRAAVQRLPLAL